MIATKYTLYDDFTYKGKFWLPPKKRRKPHKVDGILRVTAGKDISLELFGDLVKSGRSVDLLGPPDEGGSPPLIYGQTDDGQPLTLFGSFWTNRHGGGAGHVRVDYTSNLCIVGALFDGEADVQFHKLELTLTHLEGWLDAQAFHDEPRREGEEVVGLTVTHTYPETMTAEIPDPKVTFKLAAELNVDVKRNRSVKLTHISRVDLTPATPLSVEGMFKLMANVQQFFTLLVGEQVFVRKLRGLNMTRPAKPVTKAGNKLKESHDHHQHRHGAHAHEHGGPDTGAQLVVGTDPADPVAGRPVTLRLMIHGADGTMVRDFDVVHDEKVQLPQGSRA